MLLSHKSKFSPHKFSFASCSEEYNVKEPEKISYVGHGCFAVVSQNEDGTMFFKEKIQYESNESFSEMKKFVEDSKQ